VHPAFQNFRRFSRVRLRLILLKQDELSSLEASLDRIDVQEQRKLNLGCARQDDNTERKDLLKVLQRTLTEYGKTSKFQQITTIYVFRLSLIRCYDQGLSPRLAATQCRCT
jgi:hypothetical protein